MRAGTEPQRASDVVLEDACLLAGHSQHGIQLSLSSAGPAPDAIRNDQPPRLPSAKGYDQYRSCISIRMRIHLTCTRIPRRQDCTARQGQGFTI